MPLCRFSGSVCMGSSLGCGGETSLCRCAFRTDSAGFCPRKRRDDFLVDVLHRQRTRMLEADHAFGIDDEGFGDAVDAPVDRGAAVALRTDGVVGVAQLREEGGGLVGGILLVDAVERDAGL